MAVRQMLVAGRYRLREQVGAGGMGRVWLARDEMLHRDVAIKEIVLPEWMSGAEQDRLRERTLREARSAARLNHPHVVRVYDVVQAGGLSWIVMEYVPSRSLYEVLAEEGPYDPVGAARIGLAVLDALDAAHRAGVLHRDVKPHNVLIGADGRVVLTDFGLATFAGDGSVTMPGLIVGSPQYVSPERARDGASTVESDLWSFGATLYAAVEGHSPYARESAMATLAALATEPPDPPVRAGPLAEVLDGLLRYEPADRFTAAEVESRLLAIVSAEHRDTPLIPGQRGNRRAPEPPWPPDQVEVPRSSGPIEPLRSAAEPAEPRWPSGDAEPPWPSGDADAPWPSGDADAPWPSGDAEPPWSSRDAGSASPPQRAEPQRAEPQRSLVPVEPSGAFWFAAEPDPPGDGSLSVGDWHAHDSGPLWQPYSATPEPISLEVPVYTEPPDPEPPDPDSPADKWVDIPETGNDPYLTGVIALHGRPPETPAPAAPAPAAPAPAGPAPAPAAATPASAAPAPAAPAPAGPAPAPAAATPASAAPASAAPAPAGSAPAPAASAAPASAAPAALESEAPAPQALEPESPAPQTSEPGTREPGTPGRETPGPGSPGREAHGPEAPEPEPLAARTPGPGEPARTGKSRALVRVIAPPPPSERRRTARLAVAAVLTVLVGGAAVAGYVATDRPAARVAQPPVPAASVAPSATGRTAPATNPGAASGRPSRRATGFSPVICDAPAPPGLPVMPRRGAARGVNGWALPAGWSYFTDGTGFHLAVPNGWTYQRIGTTYCFRDPASARVMSIDVGRDPAADPVKACRAEDRRLRAEGRIPGYALIAVTAVPLLHRAADWDVRYQGADGMFRRASTRWLTIGGRAYAIGWAAPEAAWPDGHSELQMVRSTFYTTRADTGAGATAGRG